MTTGDAKSRSSIRRGQIWFALAVVAVLVIYFIHSKAVHERGVADFFAILQQQGYTPNVGFSGVFRPGNVIQVAEQGPNASDRQLVPPLVVAWADKCFPGQTPRTLEFALPQTEGTSSAGLSLSGDAVSRMMPSLSLDSSAVVDYKLTLENTRIQTFGKADLSGGFAAPCVTALRTAIEGGDKVEWFRVVMEALVADTFTLEMEWKDKTSIEARQRITENIRKALNQAGSGDKEASTGLKFGTTNEDTKKTTISAKGLVVMAYRARPLQPVAGP